MSGATGRRLGNPAAEQAEGPPTNPVEMGLPDIACAVYRASQRPYRALFEKVWGHQASLWFGVMAPAGTPQNAIQKIASAAEKAMHRPDAVETLQEQSFEPLGQGPDAFKRYLLSEITRRSEVARHAGVRS